MPNTYSQIYIQVVFAVRERDAIIRAEWKQDLFKYITGIITNKGQKLIAIGGVSDHIHILIGLRPDIALSDLVRDIKTASSKWINDRELVRGKFYWQEGFGAFSYSRSQLDGVIRYVLEQEARHRTRNFRDEYLQLLRRFEVEYDDRYVFDFFGQCRSQGAFNIDVKRMLQTYGSAGAIRAEHIGGWIVRNSVGSVGAIKAEYRWGRQSEILPAPQEPNVCRI